MLDAEIAAKKIATAALQQKQQYQGIEEEVAKVTEQLEALEVQQQQKNLTLTAVTAELSAKLQQLVDATGQLGEVKAAAAEVTKQMESHKAEAADEERTKARCREMVRLAKKDVTDKTMQLQETEKKLQQAKQKYKSMKQKIAKVKEMVEREWEQEKAAEAAAQRLAWMGIQEATTEAAKAEAEAVKARLLAKVKMEAAAIKEAIDNQWEAERAGFTAAAEAQGMWAVEARQAAEQQLAAEGREILVAARKRAKEEAAMLVEKAKEEAARIVATAEAQAAALTLAAAPPKRQTRGSVCKG
jgi:hypothetical protein